jgi:toxin-antitoxin system PIN domain toxin
VIHLLDANALIALAWTRHEHHEAISRWFRANAQDGWATCAFTQAAFVRVIAHPAFSGRHVGMPDILELLLRNLAHPKHKYLAVDFGMEEVAGTCTGGLLGHRQVTDAWLLTTAVRHRARLVTFDAGIAALLATDAERQRALTILGG